MGSAPGRASRVDGRARLLVLLTGGTLLMRAKPSGALEPDDVARDLLADVPILERVAAIETRVVFNLDSADMQPSEWITLARAIHDAAASGEYTGIVVVHGTDTMAYSASALALMLGPLPCPVVLTGAQRPLAEVRTDARGNLVDAALVATLDVPEVCIVFHTRVLRGARSMKRDAWGLEAFDSPNCAPLVELGLDVDIAPHVRAASPLAPFDARLESRVLSVRVFPGMDPRLISGAIGAGVRGLVLEAYGTGNLPHLGGSLIPALEEAAARHVPVLVVSQCPRGTVEMGRYDGGALAESAGAISGGDMTREAAIAKLMIGLARHGSGADLRAYLESDAVGERSA